MQWFEFASGSSNNNNRTSHSYTNTDTTKYDTAIDSSIARTYNNLTVVNDAVFSISGLIDFLGSSGDTKVVSSPKILTMKKKIIKI